MLAMLSPSLPWLTPIMITKPDRMKQEQMLLICKELITYIAGHPKSGNEFDLVIDPSPAWLTKVCKKMIKPELF